jgi:hypothetical protein
MKRLAVLVLFLPVAAEAQIYNDGGSHVLDGVGAKVQVSDSSTLTIVAPASVTNGVTVDQFSQLILQGGSVLGSNAFAAGSTAGAGIFSTGAFSSSDGKVAGGTCVTSEGTGGIGIVSLGRTRISGGTFVGGGGSPGSGIGGTGLSTSVANLLIDGGRFEGGSAARDGNRAFVSGAQDHRGSISGGTFSGFFSLVFWGTGASEVDISGGSFQDPIYAALYDSSSMSFEGNHLAFDPTRLLLTGELLDGTTIKLSFEFAGPFLAHQTPGGIKFTGTNNPSAVPEPTSIVALALGGFAIALLRHKLTT